MHPRFHAAYQQLPSVLQSAILPYLDAADFSAMFKADQVATLKQVCGLNGSTLAFALLPLAAAYSLTPISHFQVGAIAQGISGNLYFGANMEFSGAPLQQTVHAEQSAIIHAWLHGESKLSAITVNYTPCGHCRQFMNELNSGSALQIQLPTRAAATLGDYLPDSFGPNDLAISNLLMDPIDHGCQLALNDPLVNAALDAANRCHAPYSTAYSGVALEGEDGAIYAGRYAENAAFNPSLPPLQAALVLMNLSGADCQKIRRAVLVEGQNALLTQWDATRATLASLGCQQIERITF
ncbi:cytidine deaminase [Serratia sp. DD3]|uniref:cytidine deaminase n=1 Tax=Serratia sp. DD3 TaxID=1410619 RepID=UPI0003C50272|nr:cytidine deaminase [Serratia sp. DD3]KEY57847.1 cytidine deaminase [Serratia sp. DD3]